MEADKRIAELVSQISKASESYYNANGEVMTDAEFDALVDELRSLDPSNEILSSVGAPPIGQVFDHKIKVGSQEKLKTREDFDRWCDKVEAAGKSPQQYMLQHKLDGLTVVLYYEDGILIRALTRGDGSRGEDVTRNVLMMGNVSRRLPEKFTGSIRGEVMLPINTFKLVFEPMGYANPRNTAAGKLRDQKATADILKHFRVYYFDYIPEDRLMATESECINGLFNLNLDAVTHWLFASRDEVWAKYEEIKATRSSLDYEIDGVIVRAHDLNVQREMGVSQDIRPKAQRCIKFEAASGISTLIGVELSIGHTGAIVPTARVKPVEIGGVTVSNIFLNNFEEIDRLGIQIGDDVNIIRAGDVIPKITGLAKAGASRVAIKPPTHCIHCKAELVKDGAHIFCRNGECDGQSFKRLKTWIVKRNIKFVGDALLHELYVKHGIKEPWQLYDLTEEFLAKCDRGDGVVGVLAKAIMAELDKSRTCTLSEFLGSLSIPMLGRRQVELMTQNCGIDSVDGFLSATVPDLEACEGFSEGGTKATIVVSGLKKAEPLIRRMLTKVILKEVPVGIVNMAGRFTGRVLCFTGVRPSEDEKKAFEVAGGVVKDGMSKAITHLIVKDLTTTSSKAQKAKASGVELVSYDQFKGWLME